MTVTSHQGIREAIRARIVAGEWQLGELIPGEVELADQYGCSRTTVNRAVQALAEEGIVDRKRKRGTRVRPLPTPQAQVPIPIVREQVEASGRAYANEVVLRDLRLPPAAVCTLLGVAADTRCAYLESVHRADGRPFAVEERWVNLHTVPEFANADLALMSANEWLVRTVPFSRGDVAFTATAADERLAAMLDAQTGDPLFTMERTTWLEEQSVTTVRLCYAAGYRLQIAI